MRINRIKQKVELTMAEAIFSWFLIIGVLCGVLCLLGLIGKALSGRKQKIEVHIHNHPTEREIYVQRVVEREIRTYIK